MRLLVADIPASVRVSAEQFDVAYQALAQFNFSEGFLYPFAEILSVINAVSLDSEEAFCADALYCIIKAICILRKQVQTNIEELDEDNLAEIEENIAKAYQRGRNNENNISDIIPGMILASYLATSNKNQNNLVDKKIRELKNKMLDLGYAYGVYPALQDDCLNYVLYQEFISSSSHQKDPSQNLLAFENVIETAHYKLQNIAGAPCLTLNNVTGAIGLLFAYARKYGYKEGDDPNAYFSMIKAINLIFEFLNDIHNISGSSSSQSPILTPSLIVEMYLLVTYCESEDKNLNIDDRQLIKQDFINRVVPFIEAGLDKDFVRSQLKEHWQLKDRDILTAWKILMKALSSISRYNEDLDAVINTAALVWDNEHPEEFAAVLPRLSLLANHNKKGKEIEPGQSFSNSQ